MTPEQRVAEATNAACSAHETGVTVGDVVECDPCGERFAHWARWLAHREATRAAAALNAVRAALTSDDPAVVRAMAERVGLTISSRERFEAVRRDSLDTDGQPHAFSFGSDERWRISEAIHFREYGLSPETHICMQATQTSASVSTWSPWREVPDA